MGKLIILFVLSILGVCSCNIEITILHTNDIHSHFEEMKSRNGERYGGVARRKTKVRRPKLDCARHCHLHTVV